ncbi:MAG: hypothetical protein LUE23_10475, partial [Lachnospiraceae bacterium]|nr:hypothetical protein [Lachnospiraceae bacterium]
MRLKCLASDYTAVERNGVYYVYNELYEENEKKLLASALLGLLIPELSDYYIQICMEIKAADQDVVISKK